jgi:pimeloyl-ACP methyl ester carboxylesterase
MLSAGRVLVAVALIAGHGIGILAQPDAAPPTRQLPVNGVALSYVEQGSGEPVVFVHGAVGDLRFWEPQRRAVALRHRFIAYTYRYHGTAPWSDDGKQYAMATHAADLAAFVAGLKSGPVHLVGLSYGGSLSALVAMEHPELVRTLILVEPGLFSLLAESPDGKPALEAWQAGVQPVLAALKAEDAAGATKLLVDVVNNRGAGSFDKQPAALRQMLMDNARTLPLAFATPPVAVSCSALGTVKAPTLVMDGQDTAIWFSRTNEAVVRCVPGSRRVTLAGTTHLLPQQDPTAFNEAVLQFVDKR